MNDSNASILFLVLGVSAFLVASFLATSYPLIAVNVFLAPPIFAFVALALAFQDIGTERSIQAKVLTVISLLCLALSSYIAFGAWMVSGWLR